MKKITAVKWISFGVLSIGFAQLSFAEEPIGQMVWVKGTIKASLNKQPARILQRRSPLYVHDTITTSKNSTGEIVFSDNSLLTLNAETTLRIDQYKFGKSVKPDATEFAASLAKGGFRTITGLIPKRNTENYQVKTPVGTIGVRGTEYAIALKDSLWIKHYTGQPCISNESGSMCLSDARRFANVKNAKTPPIIVEKEPTVFATELPITPASYNAADNLVAPTTGSGTTTKKVDGFCIQ